MRSPGLSENKLLPTRNAPGVVYTGPLNDVELDNINDVYAFEPEPAKKREV